jgi:peroxin-2
MIIYGCGCCRTLVERGLRARLVYAKPYMQHAQSFEYLNRQLVWTELSQFMLFVLPLVDAAKLRRYVFSRLPRIGALPTRTTGASFGITLVAAPFVGSHDCSGKTPT